MREKGILNQKKKRNRRSGRRDLSRSPPANRAGGRRRGSVRHPAVRRAGKARASRSRRSMNAHVYTTGPFVCTVFEGLVATTQLERQASKPNWVSLSHRRIRIHIDGGFERSSSIIRAARTPPMELQKRPPLFLPDWWRPIWETTNTPSVPFCYFPGNFFSSSLLLLFA